MTRKILSRRRLLRGAGGAIVGLPLLDAMVGTRQAAAASPRRVIFFMTGQGFMVNQWRPNNAGDPSSSRILKPLAFVKDKMLAIEGVPQSSTSDPGNRAQGHPGGAAGALTGAYAGEGDLYGGCPDCKAGFAVSESIDSAVARHIGTATRYPSFHVGAKVLDNTPGRRFFYSAPRAPVTPIENPYQVYDQVFKNWEPTATPMVDLRLENRRSVLNAVMDDFRSLRCQLGADDAAKLTAHLDKVSDIEKRMGIGTVTAASCRKPSAAAAGINWNDWAALPATVSAQLDLVAGLVACDRTRVIGVQVGAPDANGGFFPFLGFTDEQHRISHLPDDPVAVENMVKIQVWMAEQIASLVRRLQAIPEDGGTAFDNTTILWGAEVGNPWSHDRVGMVWNIIGNGGGYFRTGRYVRFSGTRQHAHNRLHLHFLRMMGSQQAEFGAPGYSTPGPLENLV